jgi:hypothetical protein
VIVSLRIWLKDESEMSKHVDKVLAASIIRDMMEAESTSETLVNFYHTTRHYKTNDSHLHTNRRENLACYANNKLE